MKPDWDKLGKKFADSPVVTIADVDCTAAGQSLCQRVGVQGYPTIKYFTAKTGKGGRDYQGGRDFNSLSSFVENTFKAACDPFTKKGCNPQEQRYIEKIEGKSVSELSEEKLAKQQEMKELKKERSAAEKEWKEKTKAWKKKETALNKAIALLQQVEKKGGFKKKDEL